MSFFSRAQRYEMLCGIKRGIKVNPNLPVDGLTAEEEQFIRDFATEQVQDLMKDPECQAAMDRIYESRWAHRFD